MRKLLVLALFILAAGLIPAKAKAQTQPHSVTVKWTPSTDTNNTNIYRQTATCPASVTTTAGFTKLTPSPVTSTTYTDSSVNATTTYCYVATASLNGQESVPSNTAQALVPVSPPSGLSITSVVATVTGSAQTVLAKWSDTSGTQQTFFFTDGSKIIAQGLTSSPAGTFAEQWKGASTSTVLFTVCNSQGQCATQKAM